MNRRAFLGLSGIAALAAGSRPTYQRSSDEASVGLAATDMHPFVLLPRAPVGWTITEVSFQIVGLCGPAFGKLAVWFDRDDANSIHSLEFYAHSPDANGEPVTPPYLPPVWMSESQGRAGEAVLCGFSLGLDQRRCGGGFARVRVRYH